MHGVEEQQRRPQPSWVVPERGGARRPRPWPTSTRRASASRAMSSPQRGRARSLSSSAHPCNSLCSQHWRLGNPPSWRALLGTAGTGTGCASVKRVSLHLPHLRSINVVNPPAMVTGQIHRGPLMPARSVAACWRQAAPAASARSTHPCARRSETMGSAGWRGLLALYCFSTSMR